MEVVVFYVIVVLKLFCYFDIILCYAVKMRDCIDLRHAVLGCTGN